MTRHLPFLDGIRGVAILLVFLYHSLGTAFNKAHPEWAGGGLWLDLSNITRTWFIASPASIGWVGVSVFFVVSGFCIHLSHQNGYAWSEFFRRRVFRIYPAYILVILAMLPWFPSSPLEESVPKWFQAATHLLGIHNLFEATHLGINPAFWSIGVEIQLYALYPLLVLMHRRLGWRGAMWICGCTEVAIRSIMAISTAMRGQDLPHFITASPFAYWLSWAIGARLAGHYLAGTRSCFHRVNFGIVTVAFIASTLFRPTSHFSFLIGSIMAAIAIERLISKQWSAPQGKVWQHLSSLGLVSFSFYLIHQPVLFIARSLMPKIHPLIGFMAYLATYPIILLFAWMLFKWVEIPGIEWGKKHKKRL